MQEVRQNSFVLSNVTNVQMNGMEAPLLLECIHIVKIAKCSLFGIILNAKSSYKAQERRFWGKITLFNNVVVKNAGEFRCQYNKEKSGGCPPTSGAEARRGVTRPGVLNFDINVQYIDNIRRIYPLEIGMLVRKRISEHCVIDIPRCQNWATLVASGDYSSERVYINDLKLSPNKQQQTLMCCVIYTLHWMLELLDASWPG